MSKRILILAFLAMVTAIPARSQSSSGGGTIPTLEPVNAFGYTAVTHRDGTVTGKLEVRLLGTDSFVKADVHCLNIEGDDFATLSGVVTQSIIFGDVLTGLCFVSSGKDNGQGSNSPPDLVSFLVFAPCDIVVPETACLDMPQPTILPIRGTSKSSPKVREINSRRWGRGTQRSMTVLRPSPHPLRIATAPPSQPKPASR